ncbi:hypothetical protein RYX36_028832 [Vicia faba]
MLPLMANGSWMSLGSIHNGKTNHRNGLTALDLKGTNCVGLLSEVFAGQSATKPVNSLSASKIAIQIDGTRAFTYEELSAATSNFDNNAQIGQRGYKKVYKGIPSNGIMVAIKHAHQGSLRDSQFPGGEWISHQHPLHAKAARGKPGLPLQVGRILFALHDGRIAELHLAGLGGTGNELISSLEEYQYNLPDDWINSNFRLRLMYEGMSFFLVTSDGLIFEHVSIESVCIWLKHDSSIEMNGKVGDLYVLPENPSCKRCHQVQRNYFDAKHWLWLRQEVLPLSA